VSLVLDSSATLAWVHGDERTEAIERLFDRIVAEGAVVPDLWHLEIANSLTMAVRRGRVDVDFRTGVLADLADLPIRVDSQTRARAFAATVVLADTHRLSVYDAAYLELAIRLVLPLATLDRALAVAAVTAGVPLLPGA